MTSTMWEMSIWDFHHQFQGLYGSEFSTNMVSKITDKILADVKEWQSRPLEVMSPFISMDAIHYKIWEDERVINRAGHKNILIITIEENESYKFWLGMLNDYKKPWCKRSAVFLC